MGFGDMDWPAFVSLAILRAIKTADYELDWTKVAKLVANDSSLLTEANLSAKEAEKVFTAFHCSQNYKALEKSIPVPSFYLHEKNPSVRESVKHYAVILSGKRIEELEGAIKQNQQRYKTLHRAIERAKNDNLDESQLRSLLKQVVEDTDYTVRIPRPPPSAEHELSRPSPIEHAEKSPLDNDEMVVVKDAEDCAADTSDKMQTDEAEEKTVGSRSAESLANSSHPSSASLTNVEYSSSSTTLQKTGGSSGLPAASAAKKAFRNNILHLWQTIVNHKHGALFVGPVKKDDAPDYYRVVQRPMDLNTVKTRVREGLCNDTLEFERDIAQTFVNAIMFNPEDTLINAMAKEIMQMAVQEIAKFKSTEKLVAYRRNSMQSN